MRACVCVYIRTFASTCIQTNMYMQTNVATCTHADGRTDRQAYVRTYISMQAGMFLFMQSNTVAIPMATELPGHVLTP